MSDNSGNETDKVDQKKQENQSPDEKGKRLSFKDQNLKGKKFKQKDFTGANFSGANLKNAKFIDCVLKGVDFSKADLTGARFEKGTFEGVVFVDAVLTRARIKNSLWKNVSAKGTDFSNSAFQKSKFENCRFQSCGFSGAAFYNFEIMAGSFDDSSLDQVRAPDIKIESTVFIKTKLHRVDMVSAKLKDIEFENCDIKESDLSGARMMEVNFKESSFEKTEMIACDYSGSTFDKCDFNRAIIKYSRGLSEETLAMIKEQGGKVGLDLVRKGTNFLFYTKNGRIIVSLLIIVFVGYIAFRMIVPTSWSYGALQAEATKAKQAGDSDNVKKYNKIIVEKYGNDQQRLTIALLALGQVYIEENNFEQAAIFLQRAYEANKDNSHNMPELLSGLGEVSLRKKEFKKAGKWYGMILEKVSDAGYKSIAKIGMVRMYKGIGEVEKALELINSSLNEMAIDDVVAPQFIELKVKILVNEKRYDEALEALRGQLNSETREVQRSAYFQMATIERKRGNKEKAKEIFQEMVKLFPEAQQFLDNANITKAQDLFAAEKKEEGQTLLLETIDNALSPKTVREAKAMLAMHYLYSNRSDEAEKLFDDVLKEITPSDHDYWSLKINYAALIRKKGDNERAMKLLNEVIEGESDDIGVLQWVYRERAESHKINGNIDKAISDLKIARKYSEDDNNRDEIALYTVQIAAYHGDPDDAIALYDEYDKEIKDKERHKRMTELLAGAYIKGDKPKMAITIFDRIYKSCKKDEECRMQFFIETINALVQMGNSVEALEKFKEMCQWKDEEFTVSFNSNLVSGLFYDMKEADEYFITFYNKVIAYKKEVNTLDNNYYTTLNNLADKYQHMGILDKAEELYSETIKNSKDPHPVMHAFENRVRFAFEQNDYEGARKIIEEYAKIGNESAKFNATLFMADLLSRIKKEKEAIESLENLVDDCINQDCCRAVDQLHVLYRMKEERGKLWSLYVKSKEKWSDCWALENIRNELNME